MDYFTAMFKSHLEQLEFTQLHEMLYKIHKKNLLNMPEPKAIFTILHWKLLLNLLQWNQPRSMLLLLLQYTSGAFRFLTDQFQYQSNSKKDSLQMFTKWLQYFALSI
jgi:hypothetical protein